MKRKRAIRELQQDVRRLREDEGNYVNRWEHAADIRRLWERIGELEGAMRAMAAASVRSAQGSPTDEDIRNDERVRAAREAGSPLVDALGRREERP